MAKSKWKKEGYDYGDAILLKFGTDPGSRIDRDQAIGSYSSIDRTITIADPEEQWPWTLSSNILSKLEEFKDNPRRLNKLKEAIEVTRRERNIDLGSEVLAHELAHWSLGHSIDKETQEERIKQQSIKTFGTSDWDEVYEKYGSDPYEVLEAFEDEVTEFEVYLYQEIKGWYQGDPDYNINFMSFFRQELQGHPISRSQAKTIKDKKRVWIAANTAISNLLKKGHISKEKAKYYRQQIDRTAKRLYKI